MAPTGAETTKADCPQLPTTLEELVETAQECEAAGAAMIHVHIRDAEHRPTLDLGRLTDTVAALRESTDLVVQLSTGGSVHDPLDQRLQGARRGPGLVQPDDGHHQLRRRRLLQPVAVRHASSTSSARSARWCRSSSCSTSARCTRCIGCSTRYGLPYGGKVHVDFVMGVPGGMPGTAAALVAGVAALPARGDAWSATGIGRTTLPVALASLSKGGHLRVGMEDVLTISRGVPVEQQRPARRARGRAGRLAQRTPMPARGARAARLA